MEKMEFGALAGKIAAEMRAVDRFLEDPITISGSVGGEMSSMVEKRAKERAWKLLAGAQMSSVAFDAELERRTSAKFAYGFGSLAEWLGEEEESPEIGPEPGLPNWPGHAEDGPEEPLDEGWLKSAEEQARGEILEDLREGRFSAEQIKGFGDLHDFVDAGEYGPAVPGDYGDGSLAVRMALMAELQERLNRWIEDGGFAAAAEAGPPRTISEPGVVGEELVLLVERPGQEIAALHYPAGSRAEAEKDGRELLLGGASRTLIREAALVAWDGEIITLLAWPEIGSWYEIGHDPLSAELGYLHAPMLEEGAFSPQEIGSVDFTLAEVSEPETVKAAEEAVARAWQAGAEPEEEFGEPGPSEEVRRFRDALHLFAWSARALAAAMPSESEEEAYGIPAYEIRRLTAELEGKAGGWLGGPFILDIAEEALGEDNDALDPEILERAIEREGLVSEMCDRLDAILEHEGGRA